MIVTPALPSASLEPVCSGCQCVLNKVRTGALPGSAPTACANAAAFSASPPSTSTTPSDPVCATTFAPAPLSRNSLSPNPVVVIAAGVLAVCANRHGAAAPAAAAFKKV